MADPDLRPDPPASGSSGVGRRSRRGALGELALLFGRLGAVAFGGPAAHIAMMDDEVVRRRKWLSDGEFLDLLGATNLIPGPNSTEMAIHIGLVRAGWRGLLVAGFCFIAPAVALTTLLAWAYVRFEALPEIGWLLYGIKPVVLAIIVQAIVGLAPRAARSKSLAALSIAAVVAAWLGANEVLLLLAAGVASAAMARIERGSLGSLAALATPSLASTSAGLPAVAAAPTLTGLFLVFVKIGSVLFGSGYVLLAFLRADLVERLGWLTPSQLIDAVAIGQVTPGPVFTTATFVGYLVAGFPGAAAATVGIFLPAFALVAISGPLLPRLRSSALAGSILDGVNAASLALMVVVTGELARTAIVDVPTAVLLLLSASLLLTRKLGPTALVLGGGGLGFLLRSLAS